MLILSSLFLNYCAKTPLGTRSWRKTSSSFSKSKHCTVQWAGSIIWEGNLIRYYFAGQWKANKSSQSHTCLAFTLLCQHIRQWLSRISRKSIEDQQCWNWNFWTNAALHVHWQTREIRNICPRTDGGCWLCKFSFLHSWLHFPYNIIIFHLLVPSGFPEDCLRRIHVFGSW